MTDAPQATATTIVTPPAPPRWSPMLQAFVGVIGALVTVGGLLIAIGGWQGKLDNRVTTLERDMIDVKANQRQYIPVLVGMKADLAFLADRARREDDRRDRELRERGQ